MTLVLVVGQELEQQIMHGNHKAGHSLCQGDLNEARMSTHLICTVLLIDLYMSDEKCNAVRFDGGTAGYMLLSFLPPCPPHLSQPNDIKEKNLLTASFD